MTNNNSLNYTPPADDFTGNKLDGDLCTDRLDAVDRDLEECGQKPRELRLLSEQRFKEENLEWKEHQDNKTEYIRVYFDIVDADGVVYDGILLDDGTVDDGWTKYDSADTFERYNGKGEQQGELVEVAEKWRGRHHYTLYQCKQTEELFLHRYHRQVYPSDFVSSVNTAPHLAWWLFDLHEQQTVTFLQTGHVVVSLPVELRNQINLIARHEDRTMRDWIVERLSECIQDERYTAILATEKDFQTYSVADFVQNVVKSGINAQSVLSALTKTARAPTVVEEDEESTPTPVNVESENSAPSTPVNDEAQTTPTPEAVIDAKPRDAKVKTADEVFSNYCTNTQ
jgi:hypothetical protein